MNLFVALKCFSFARALTLQILFLVLKEYTIVAACKPSFADFTQVHVQENSDYAVIYPKIYNYNLYSVHSFVISYVNMHLFPNCDYFIQKWT